MRLSFSAPCCGPNPPQTHQRQGYGRMLWPWPPPGEEQRGQRASGGAESCRRVGRCLGPGVPAATPRPATGPTQPRDTGTRGEHISGRPHTCVCGAHALRGKRVQCARHRGAAKRPKRLAGTLRRLPERLNRRDESSAGRRRSVADALASPCEPPRRLACLRVTCATPRRSDGQESQGKTSLRRVPCSPRPLVAWRRRVWCRTACWRLSLPSATRPAPAPAVSCSAPDLTPSRARSVVPPPHRRQVLPLGKRARVPQPSSLQAGAAQQEV